MEPGPHFRKHLYFEIPHMVTCNYVELVHDLMAVKLEDMPARVEGLAVELARRADEAQARIATLGDDYDLSRERVAVEVERETDKLGELIQSSLDYWGLSTSPLLRRDPKPGEEHEHARNEDLAYRAGAAKRAMFGDDGLEFMRMSYPERFRVLMAMIRTMREDEQLLELLHKPVRLYVEKLGELYEQRAIEHLRERDESRGLGEHRVALRWGLAVYASEVGDLADRWSEDSCARVNASLGPYVGWAKRMKDQH